VHGHLVVLQWLISEGCPYNNLSCAVAAVQNRHPDVVKWLHGIRKKTDDTWDERLCARAAFDNNIPMLEFLRKLECPLDTSAFNMAAAGGYMELLKKLLYWNCPMGVQTMSAAANDSGNLDVMKWLHKHGCPMDAFSCATAAKNGDLGMLMWLRSVGCPWDDRVYNYASYEGHSDLIIWAVANGCERKQESAPCSYDRPPKRAKRVIDF
jgi:hypothetical protein